MAGDVTVWVDECFAYELEEDSWSTEDDPQDQWASGLFRVTLDAPGPWTEDREGPRAVDVEAALAWARARTDRVVVRLASVQTEMYSAGREHVFEVTPLPLWPPEGLKIERRRAAGYEFMDRTGEDPPIAWAALVAIGRGLEAVPPAFGEVFAEQLTPLVENLEYRVIDLEPLPTSPGWSMVYGTEGYDGTVSFGEVALASFTVDAPTRDQAALAASRGKYRA